ncbi:MAG: DNA translocase FtsK [Rhizobiales bacterium]|nr:DNA translocase FtsK [Hyphomicrobiales bacterium]
MRSGSGYPTTAAFNEGPHGLAGVASRLAARAAGLALLVAAAFAIASLATWSVADPSFSHATDAPAGNAMGYAGAVFSDLAMQFLGLASVAALAPGVIWGVLLASGRTIDRLPRRGAAWAGAGLASAAIAGCLPASATWPLPTGLGGVIGDMVLSVPGWFLGGYPQGLAGAVVALVVAVPGLWLFLFGAGLSGRHTPLMREPHRRAAAPQPAEAEEDEDDGDDSSGMLALGALTHWWLSLRAFARRSFGRQQPAPLQRAWRNIPMEEDDEAFWPEAEARTEQPQAKPRATAPAPRSRIEPEFADEGGFDEPPFDMEADEDEDFAPAPARAARPAPAAPAAARVGSPAPRPQPGARIQREAQTSLLGSGRFEMPSLHFLSEPKSIARDPSLSKDALEQNARMLEGVLEDFGVKGEIIHVRPGPVVTLYELEPAPGIKSSRVIGLADDIARSMSAIAARVAVVPGRNAIGIELPNPKRETVYLRELLASKDFEQSKAKLSLALGKTINGEAVIADIAKFPHLLVAGTTGSGKSVAINTFILSLLYRMTPQECRLIMIDPKMLELSVYDGIPHLLTPVVTDPKKAVVALKWTVREMEDRYRKMSKVGVRNIDGFNQRVAAAQKKGEQITRTVQTGFDRQTGEAIYETESLDLEPMPYIVVIIDEMADLMMVAGKDIEGAVQRLAQMARAAGIHVIMATQRPSVDVITGTIKANFPTRISFQVTSKIDSRTILGEMGAEQLLGMGDMLYMAGGGRIQRVHGPFVSDEEVEKVVAHLKLQGAPEYLDAITEDDEEDDEDGPSGGGGSGGGGNFDDSDDPYDQAVAVVLRDGKASTSYIQRRLGIGYNRAASIIEKMEREGIVGPANHAGKREILVPTEEDKF